MFGIDNALLVATMRVMVMMIVMMMMMMVMMMMMKTRRMFGVDNALLDAVRGRQRVFHTHCLTDWDGFKLL